jgi:23S rRNA pseudouridine2605 synthase
MSETTVRLNKYLANLGLTSRRNIAELLKIKDVQVNGQKVVEIGVRVDPDKDVITIDGEAIKPDKTLVYFILNKPRGVISTAKDELGRKTVMSFVKTKERVYPVGRLDENTTGLILLTNDGELTNFLTHPKYHAPKTYEVIISDKISESKLNILKKGVFLKEEKTGPAEVDVLEENPKRTVLNITIHEGKNHQIRKMFSKLKLNIVALKRVAIGSLELGNLKIGESRQLTEEEVRELRKVV